MAIQGEGHGWDTFEGSLLGKKVVWAEGALTMSGTIYFSMSDGRMLVGLDNGDSREIQ